MKIIPPSWLDETAHHYFLKTAKHIKDRLTPSNLETFAVVAHLYSMVRQEQDSKLKKQLIAEYMKGCVEFGLTPKSNRRNEPKQEQSDALSEWLAT